MAWAHISHVNYVTIPASRQHLHNLVELQRQEVEQQPKPRERERERERERKRLKYRYIHIGWMKSVLESVLVFLTCSERMNRAHFQIRDDISREKPMPFGGGYRQLHKKSLLGVLAANAWISPGHRFLGGSSRSLQHPSVWGIFTTYTCRQH